MKGDNVTLTHNTAIEPDRVCERQHHGRTAQLVAGSTTKNFTAKKRDITERHIMTSVCGTTNNWEAGLADRGSSVCTYSMDKVDDIAVQFKDEDC